MSNSFNIGLHKFLSVACVCMSWPLKLFRARNSMRLPIIGMLLVWWSCFVKETASSLLTFSMNCNISFILQSEWCVVVLQKKLLQTAQNGFKTCQRRKLHMEYAYRLCCGKLTSGVPYDCICDKSFSIERTFIFSQCGFPILRNNDIRPTTH